MESSLYILDVCIPREGWQTPVIFSEDSPTEMKQMDAAVAEARSLGYTATTKRIHGMAIGPLREFLNRK